MVVGCPVLAQGLGQRVHGDGVAGVGARAAEGGFQESSDADDRAPGGAVDRVESLPMRRELVSLRMCFLRHGVDDALSGARAVEVEASDACVVGVDEVGIFFLTRGPSLGRWSRIRRRLVISRRGRAGGHKRLFT